MGNCEACADKQRNTYSKQQEKAFRVEMYLLFAMYGSQGVPLDELQRYIRSSSLASSIAEDKLRAILLRADSNADTFITYAEFTNMYSHNGTTQKKSALQRILDAAVTNIAPGSKKGEFIDGYDCKPPPFFMFIMSALQIGVFIYFAIELQRSGGTVTRDKSLPSTDPFRYSPRRRYETWRYFTYMFVHQGYIHLINNLILQLVFGLPLEMYHEWRRILVVYLVGVFGGSLAHSVTDFNTGLAGASGGCYAIIGAHIANVIINWSEMNYGCTDCSSKRWAIRVLSSAYTRLVIILGFIGWDTGYALYRRFSDTGATKVGIAAHFGGLLTGFMVGIVVLKNLNIKQWERILGWVSLGLYIAAVAACILFNIFYNHYPENDRS